MLGRYAAEFFEKSPALIFPLIALGIFLTVFVTLSVRAIRMDRAQTSGLSRLPFEGEERYES